MFNFRFVHHITRALHSFYEWKVKLHVKHIFHIVPANDEHKCKLWHLWRVWFLRYSIQFCSIAIISHSLRIRSKNEAGEMKTILEIRLVTPWLKIHEYTLFKVTLKMFATTQDVRLRFQCLIGFGVFACDANGCCCLLSKHGNVKPYEKKNVFCIFFDNLFHV